MPPVIASIVFPAPCSILSRWPLLTSILFLCRNIYSPLRHPFEAIALGLGSALVLARHTAPSSNGLLYAWGSRAGVLLNSTVGISSPQLVISLSNKDVTKVSAGYSFAMAVVQTNTGSTELYTWGECWHLNSYQLKAVKCGSQAWSHGLLPPVLITDAIRVCAVALLTLHCSIGEGISGQLGLGDNSSRAEPTLVSRLPPHLLVVDIAAGGSHSLATVMNVTSGA